MITIGPWTVGDRTLVVAEVGSNHCGDPELARRSVAAAVSAGADAIKLQLYDPDTIIEPAAPVLGYVPKTHATQRERFRSLILGRDVFLELAELSRQAGLLFLVTPFDEEAVAFLDPLVPAFKVASGDLTNLRLLRRIFQTGKPVIVSTGFATLDEIDWLCRQVPPERLVLLHCVGAYPTPAEQVHLGAIPFLRQRYGVPVGFSDHTVGIEAAVGAVAAGACLIEKHFMLSRDLPVADVTLSATPDELARMVQAIRRMEPMAGRPGKAVQPSEEYFRVQLRRSVYAARLLDVGEVVAEKDVIPLRPWVASGVDAAEIDSVIGCRVARRIERETPIRADHLEGLRRTATGGGMR